MRVRIQCVALSYQIDSGIVTITGDYADADEWVTLLAAVVDDPQYRHGFSFLRDLRAAKHPVDAATVMRIIAVVRDYWGLIGAHRAAIVTGTRANEPADVAHALAEYEHLPLRTFVEYGEAVAWLRETSTG